MWVSFMKLNEFQNHRVYLENQGILNPNVQRQVISAYLNSSSGRKIEDFAEKYNQERAKLTTREKSKEGTFCLNETLKDLATIVMLEVFN